MRTELRRRARLRVPVVVALPAEHASATLSSQLLPRRLAAASPWPPRSSHGRRREAPCVRELELFMQLAYLTTELIQLSACLLELAELIQLLACLLELALYRLCATETYIKNSLNTYTYDTRSIRLQPLKRKTSNIRVV